MFATADPSTVPCSRAVSWAFWMARKCDNSSGHLMSSLPVNLARTELVVVAALVVAGLLDGGMTPEGGMTDKRFLSETKALL